MRTRLNKRMNKYNRSVSKYWMKIRKIPGVINKASVHLLSPLQLFKLLDEADVEHENSDIVPLIKLYLTIWCVLRICFPVWVWGQSLPVIAEDRPGQAKSVGRRAVHVLHHLVLHLLQDQVQGLSWKYVLSIILKEPGSLKGLVKLWTICRVLVLPGLQMDSKADHDPHANWDWWKYVFYAMTLASYGLK